MLTCGRNLCCCDAQDGWSCSSFVLGATNATSVCSPICGDGKIKGSEALMIILQLYHPIWLDDQDGFTSSHVRHWTHQWSSFNWFSCIVKNLSCWRALLAIIFCQQCLALLPIALSLTFWAQALDADVINWFIAFEPVLRVVAFIATDPVTTRDTLYSGASKSSDSHCFVLLNARGARCWFWSDWGSTLLEVRGNCPSRSWRKFPGFLQRWWIQTP